MTFCDAAGLSHSTENAGCDGPPNFFSEISGEGGSDPDYSSIIISPFSNFLSNAVIKGIESANLKKDKNMHKKMSNILIVR